MSETGGIVRAGPFAGLRYPVARAAGSSLAPKLLGSYELEIQDFVERAIASRPARVVNIGAGEGYYAVGLALRLPEASVFAFERNESARALVRALAEHNGVASRVHVHGECRIPDLCGLTTSPSLVVCDVEGAERHLLDPASVIGLSRSEIIAELHEVKADGLIVKMRDRFRRTHHQKFVQYQGPAARRVLHLEHLSFGDRRIALDERRRNGLDWMHFVPVRS